MMLYRMIVLVLLIACDGKGTTVVWGPTVQAGAPTEPLEFPGDVKPQLTSGCPASLRVAMSEGSAFATWWQTRPDSSGLLLVSRSMHGGPWEPPVIADSTAKRFELLREMVPTLRRVVTFYNPAGPRTGGLGFARFARRYFGHLV